MSKKDDIIMDAIMIAVCILSATAAILIVISMIINYEVRVVFGSIFGLIGVSFLIAWIKNKIYPKQNG